VSTAVGLRSLSRRRRVPVVGAVQAFGRPADGQGRGMFFFFSNRLGCLGSLLLSIAVTAVLLLLLGVL
jgi:hypothetical protein